MGIGAAIGTAVFSAKQAGKATEAQVGASRGALDLQRDIFEQQTEAQEPFREVGLDATTRLAGLAGLQGPEAQTTAFEGFETSPGFEFRLAEGTRAVESSAAARGGLLSGKTLRGVTEVAQGTASQEFGNYVSQLQSLAGLGPQATAQQNIAGSEFARGGSASLRDIGEARASGFINKANIATGTTQSLLDLASFGLGSFG